MTRGDVVLVRVLHASGSRGKKRPVVVIQSDQYLGTLGTIIVAEVTSNLEMADDPACLLIEVNTQDGQATGLLRDSIISGLRLVTVYTTAVDQTMGKLSPAMLIRFEGCLRVAMCLP